MQEGARLLMRGLLDEMEPAITDLREGFEAMGPALAEYAAAIGPALTVLLDQVDDIRNYQAPEFMPNGDIIIRRKPEAPIWMPDPDTGEIEL
ncbi:MAG: AAA+ family ATPase [Yoonia sp.]|uniref:AAA+ family ATPase n=1 Tax=Yoonia sp. TaxID=2212373 RepID=UPI003EF6DA68